MARFFVHGCYLLWFECVPTFVRDARRPELFHPHEPCWILALNKSVMIAKPENTREIRWGRRKSRNLLIQWTLNETPFRSAPGRAIFSVTRIICRRGEIVFCRMHSLLSRCFYSDGISFHSQMSRALLYMAVLRAGRMSSWLACESVNAVSFHKEPDNTRAQQRLQLSYGKKWHLD